MNYEIIDPLKILMQKEGRSTSSNLKTSGFREVPESRGETAYVIDIKDSYLAFVQEGLGSKNLVADEMQKLTGKIYYKEIAQDTVACIVNDLAAVGAKPIVINAYWATYSYEWFKDRKRAKAFINGWRKACDIAGASWGGGETQSLSGVIKPGIIEVAGAGIGIIKPKKRLSLGKKLKKGDRILFITSSGIHANGITLARKISKRLPKGYKTKLSNGKTYGEAILTPTYIYAKFVQKLFESDIDIHYMVNITGHGWRKLMRANREFSYIVETIPEHQPEFDLIQKATNNSDAEMYGTFNMGAGFALYIKPEDVEKTKAVASKNGFKTIDAGYLESGPQKVVIKPKNIVFESKSLKLR